VQCSKIEVNNGFHVHFDGTAPLTLFTRIGGVLQEDDFSSY
jgi:hypothetical protein